MFRNFSEIINFVKGNSFDLKVAIAGAEKRTSIEAAEQMITEKIAAPILFGKKEIIEKKASEMFPNIKFEIIDCEDDEKSSHCAVDYAFEGKADIILKGGVPTATLLKAVLRKENGLKESDVLTDILIYEDPTSEEGKLIAVADGGMIPLPGVKEKIAIAQAGSKVLKKLGIETPKIALISAVEKPSPKIQSTMDAVTIKEKIANGEVKIDGIVDGPFAIDNVISKEAAEIKGIDSPLAGSADMLLMPNIETGNVMGKILNYYLHAANGHVIMGAKVPVLITSRADDSATKLNSVALGIIVSMKGN